MVNSMYETLSAREVAKYILKMAPKDENDEYGKIVTKGRLQWFLYFAQKFALATYDKAIFEEEIKMSENGPEVEKVRDAYAEYGNELPPYDEGELPPLPNEWQAVINAVWEMYGNAERNEIVNTEPLINSARIGDTITVKSIYQSYKDNNELKSFVRTCDYSQLYEYLG